MQISGRQNLERSYPKLGFHSFSLQPILILGGLFFLMFSRFLRFSSRFREEGRKEGRKGAWSPLHLCLYLSVSIHIYLYLNLHLHLRLRLYLYLYLYLHLCLHLYLFLFLYLYLFLCLYLSDIYIYLSTYLKGLHYHRDDIQPPKPTLNQARIYSTPVKLLSVVVPQPTVHMFPGCMLCSIYTLSITFNPAPCT